MVWCIGWVTSSLSKITLTTEIEIELGHMILKVRSHDYKEGGGSHEQIEFHYYTLHMRHGSYTS